MDHSIYDKRGYPILDVREGYKQWAQTYEMSVHDEMDLRLLEQLRSVKWAAAKSILDLACGTGRVGAWLKSRCAGAVIDGVDITADMLEIAREKHIYRKLELADVFDTKLPDHCYDLCTQSLADEHLAELAPLYREAARITRGGGTFVIVGYHPQFLLAGVPTHFDRSPGEPVTIRCHVHLFSDHVKAAHAAGWSLLEMDEKLVDDAWVQKKPKWQKYHGLPISFAMVWRRGQLSGAM